MAIARVQSAKNNSGASSVTTLNVVFGGAPTDGNIVVLAASGNGVMSILSTSGITWLAANITNSSVICGTIGLGRVFSGASATITVNQVSSVGMSIVAVEYSGTNIRQDRAISATGTSVSPASGATSTTTSSNELWVGALFGRLQATFSAPTNSFSIVDQDTSTIGSTNDKCVAFLERLVSSTGTPNAGATLSSSANWVARVLTFEEVPTSTTVVQGGFFLQ